jgi:putative phage-type endonuclease
MIKNLNKISTVNMSHEDWLEQRKKGLGGSDASAIIGLNTYSSPYTVWAEKLGKLPPKEDNEAMRLGRDLEAYVAERFTEATGKKVRRENAILYNLQYPFAHANVDRMVVGEDAGLECKTTSVLNMKSFKNGEFPVNYYCQCVHYMMVTGCKKWYLAVLVLGKEFLVFEIERDEDEIKALAESEKAFWKLVLSNTPPEVDGAVSTTNTINTIFPKSISEDAVNLFAYESDLVKYMALGEQIKALKAQQDELANKVKVFMNEAGKGESDHFRVSWTSSDRSTFDAKKFASDHKDMDLSNYYKTTSTRTFRVNEKKEK